MSNWLDEIEEHLGEGGLGIITLAYGSKLRELKNKAKGKDTDTGVPMLDVNRLAKTNIVLTTYESLRDYQISFAQISFGVVIFDEIQKTKNPKSLLSRAAAAVNGSFQVGLSGTPVENSLADLWTILDVLAPGLVKHSLKEFMSEYSGSPEEPETREKLLNLQSELLKAREDRIPPVLRRLKSEVFSNNEMPQKIVHLASDTSATMPPEQESAYLDQLHRMQRREIKTVQGLQILKRISLAPRQYDQWMGGISDFISSSAKLSKFFQILDTIKERNEKALIFVETRELQPILAQVLKERYYLEKLPLIINGSVSGPVRQNSVKQFQAEAVGFNVILISPKAGGVGLNLTAANNVIHLERWWNPAVEDQCNDRAYRIKQTKDVNIYTPVSRHPKHQIPSFDLVLDDILSRKRQLARSLFVPTDISSKDFEDIFGSAATKVQANSFAPMSLTETYSLETGEEFEQYVASALHDEGFTITPTPRSWDGGCDLIAKDANHVILCQVKQVQSDKVLGVGVDEIIKAKKKYASRSPTHLAIITNAQALTRTQVTLARNQNVFILDGGAVQHYGQALRQHLEY